MATLKESTTRGVEALRGAILSQARRQAREALHEAQLEVESIRQQAEQEAEEVSEEILARARHEMALEKQRQVSGAQLEVHRRRLAQREELIEAVFAAAAARLAELRDSDAYPENLRRLTIQAAAGLDRGKLTVLASQQDAALLDDQFLDSVTRKLEQGTTLAPGRKALDIDAGIVVESADGRVRFDNTFAGRLERFRDLLRAEAYRIVTEGN